MPSTSVKLAEIFSKIVFEEHPTLARFGRFDEAEPRFLAQHGGRHEQELRGVREVERAHDLVLFIVALPCVVSTCLQARLPIQISVESLEVLLRKIFLQGVQVFTDPVRITR